MKKIGLTKIDMYIIKKFLGTFVFMIALILSISVVFDINEKIDKFMSNNAPFEAIIVDYYLNFIPYYANLFSPLFIFIAVIFFTSKLASNSEVIAILSNGIGFTRMLRPYMISAAVIALFSFFMSGYIIPPANKTRIEFEQTYINPDRKKTGDRDIQFKVAKNTNIYFESFDMTTNTGRNFSIDNFDGLELVSRLTARSIVYDSLYHWTIKDYEVREFDGPKESITKGTSIDTIIQVLPNDFIVAKYDQQMMTNPQLKNHVKSQRERGLGNIQAFEIEYHSRFASVFSAFILTIIGASLSARKVKGGMGVNIGIGLVLSMGYILFMTISSSFAVNGSMSPMIAAWVPNIVFIFIAFFLFKRAPN